MPVRKSYNIDIFNMSLNNIFLNYKPNMKILSQDNTSQLAKYYKQSVQILT